MAFYIPIQTNRHLVVCVSDQPVLVDFFVYALSIMNVVLFGKYAPAWEDSALLYSRLTDKIYQQLFFGVVVGLLIGVQTYVYQDSQYKDFLIKVRRYAIWIVAFIALVMPYIDRMLPNASSIELAKIGKITFENKQTTSNQRSNFVTGPGATNTPEARINSVGASIALLENISTKKPDKTLFKFPARLELKDSRDNSVMCQGMIQRDKAYIDIISKTHVNLSNKTLTDDEEIKRLIKYDEKFFYMLRPVERCLRRYAEKFSDYRLLLIDVKPLVNSLTAAASLHDNDAKSDLIQSLSFDIEDRLIKLTRQANENLKRISSNDFECEVYSLRDDDDVRAVSASEEQRGLICQSDDTKNKDKILIYSNEKEYFTNRPIACDIIDSLGSNKLPYKTFALAYLLSAVGSVDKGSLHIAEWIERYQGRVHPWYILRAQIELSLRMQDSLPDGEHNPIYQRYIEAYLRNFASILPKKNILAWSRQCHHNQNDYERLLYSSYVAMANSYVKASADLDHINQDVLSVANDLQQFDISCFDNVPGHVGDAEGSRASILTNYGVALLAASYSDRMFGRGQEDKQKELRSQARASISEALRLFDKSRDKAKDNPQNGGSDLCLVEGGAQGQPDREREMQITRRASRVFTRDRWGDQQAVARGALRRILDEPE